MTRPRPLVSAVAAVAATACIVATSAPLGSPPPTGPRYTPNPTGVAETFTTNLVIDTGNPFFQSLGANGRSCSSCHQQSDGWTVVPASLVARFEASGGTDPVFRPVDGANSPRADVSTVEARRRAYSMLLTKGLIRIGLAVPATAEFELVAVDDPYGYASAAELSLFRRPLPSANLAMLSTLMWDGRETFKDPASHDCLAGTTTCFSTLQFDLLDQANAATMQHAQGATPLTDAQRAAIVRFETGVFTAQAFDAAAGQLDVAGGRGGALLASRTPFHFGVNDALAGDYLTHAAFDPSAMSLFAAWVNPAAQPGDTPDRIEARRAVARGQALFDTKPIAIVGVAGLNDDLHLPVIAGTCTTCHDTPNAGNHSVPAPLNIGLADASRRTPDMPLYTLRNKTTGATTQTTDPGRALVTGKWVDIGRFKGPILRAVASRAPYFHNGFASDLGAVVDFYDTRFAIGLSDQEKADLVAFLRTL